jgi:hypothetical protein
LLQLQPPGRPAGQKVLDRSSAMDRRSIPDEEQLARDLSQEVPQEADHVLTVEGALLLHHHQQLALHSDGADRVMALITERWSRLRCSHAGWASDPPGHRYAPRKAKGKTPTDPQTESFCPPLWPLFKLGPALLFPVPYGLLLSLIGPVHWFSARRAPTL